MKSRILLAVVGTLFLNNGYSETLALKKIREIKEHSEIYIETATPSQSSLATDLKKALPQSSQIIPYSKSILLIRLKSPASKDLLKKIRGVRGVAYADFNRTYKHLDADGSSSATTTGVPCIQNASSSQAQQLSTQVQAVKSQLDAKNSCGAAEECSALYPGNKLWAQTKVDRDAMLDQMRQWGLSNPKDSAKVKVAVLDTGLDTKGMSERNLIADGAKYSFAPGFPEAGDPKRDETGHGTPIFSLFMGRDIGLATNTDLTVMRIVEKGNKHSTSDAAIQSSVLKACEDGNQVIILSWGDLDEEKGEKSFFSDHMKKTLRDKGCTVVRAAGNDSIRDVNKKSNSLDESDLTVSSIDRSGAFSNFSSGGMTAAPGSNVYTYPTQDPENFRIPIARCSDGKGELINGTSFAGPITGAILAEAETVLSSKPEYASLSGPEKVALRNRIVKASEFGGSVNGLRAVLIAKNWSKGADQSVSNLKTLVNQPESSNVCKLKREDCSSQSCPWLSLCVANNGLRLKVCSPSPDSESMSKHLSDLVGMGNPDALMEWFQTVKQAKDIQGPVKTSYFQALWKYQFPEVFRQYNISTDTRDSRKDRQNMGQGLKPETALRVAPEVIRSLPNDSQKEKKVDEIAELTLAGRSISNQIYKSNAESWSTLDKANELKELFKALDESGGDSFETAVNHWMSGSPKYSIFGYEFGSQPIEETKIGEVVWGLNALRSDPVFKKHEEFLNGKIASLLRDFNNRKDEQITDGVYSVIEPAIDHDKDALIKQAQEGLQRDRLEKLGRADVRYLIGHAEALGPQKNLFLAKTLKQIDSDDTWGASDYALSAHAINQAIWLSDKPDANSEILASTLRSIPGNAQDPALLGATFDVFSTIREKLRENSPEDLKKAQDSVKLLSVVYDDNLSGLLYKRFAMAYLSDGDKLHLPPEKEVLLIKQLSSLPDGSNKTQVNPVRSLAQSKGENSDALWNARSNHELVDALLAQIIERLRASVASMKEIGDQLEMLKNKQKPNEQDLYQGMSMSAKIMSALSTMGSAQSELGYLKDVFPKDLNSEGKNWVKVAEAVQKYRTDPVASRQHIADPWVSELLKPVDH